MKAADIINQLRAVVPFHTDLFSTQLPAVLTAVGNTVTADTSPTAHGLAPGDTVTINGALTPFSIDTLTFDSGTGIVTGVTNNNHDLTEGYQENITIVDAIESDYNGTFALLTVPNRKTFTYAITGTPSTPATGTIFMLDPLNTSFTGAFTVVTVPTVTTFTYTSNSLPESPAQGSPLVNIAPRISGAVSEDRLQDAYTAQAIDDFWAFVVLGDTATSRDRAILSDADNQIAAETKKRLRQIETFSIYVLVPTTDEIAARAARDTMDDVKLAFLKALYGFKAPSVYSDPVWCEISPTGDAFADYNTAVYVHRFDWQRVVDLVIDDAVDPAFSRAWRDSQLDFLNSFGTVTMSSTIDMDDVPL